MTDLINSFIELFTIIMVYNVLFDKKKIKDIALSGVVAIICAITHSIPIISVLFPLLAFTILVKFRYKETIRNSIVRILVSFVIFIIMETIVGIIVSLGGKDVENNYLTYVLIAVFTICLFIINLLKTKILQQLLEFVRVNIRISLLFISNILIILLIIKFIKINMDTSNRQLAIISVLLLGFIFVSIFICKEILSEMSKKKDLENKVKQNTILNDCFQQLKQHEHEYKNHLNVIYSMLQLGRDDNTLKRVKNYIEENKNLDNLNDFLYVDNFILRAVVFSKLSEMQKLGIKFEYYINSDLQNININENELTVVITNLLTNAIEGAKECESPYVCIRTEEADIDGKIKTTIEIQNTAKDLDKIDISEIFKAGSSSKGKDRGYGLSNVKKIVEQNNGDILVEISDKIISIKVILT